MLKVTLKKAVTASIVQSVVFTRPVSSVTFSSPAYTKKQGTANAIVSEVTEFASTSGLDGGGAESVTLSGPAHSGSTGHPDKFERTTGPVFDKNGQQLYWYRKSDGRFFDRIHFPRKTQANIQSGVFTKKDDYVPISQADFASKKAPKV
ncbi:hypothetical protein AURDEDRAFT_161914 [Auricularia subglabra TFB-10046 SS5]|nr:hypothetical protein AURDEDRAFT_161914 [Auricularia subglabra TFB-10046 SS5]